MTVLTTLHGPGGGTQTLVARATILHFNQLNYSWDICIGRWGWTRTNELRRGRVYSPQQLPLCDSPRYVIEHRRTYTLYSGVLAFTGQASGIYRSVQLSPRYLQYAYQLPAISNVFWLNPFHRLVLFGDKVRCRSPCDSRRTHSFQDWSRGRSSYSAIL